MLLPVGLAPILAGTLRHAVYESRHLTVDVGWLAIVGIPVAIVAAVAAWIMVRNEEIVGVRVTSPMGLDKATPLP
jgi:hypothetical protein